MTINIKPSDVVKRGLWDTYVYYVVGSEKDAEQLLLKDEEFILSERDAIVIGLLKVMETDNLIHRFNDYITHFLSVKSNKEGDGFYIKIKSIEHAIEVFNKKFPSYWNMPINYKKGYDDLVIYMSDFENKVKNLDIHTFTIQNNKYDFYLSNAVKKLLTFNHY